MGHFQKSKVLADPVLSTDVENVYKTVEMREYRSVLERSTLDSIESVNEEITDIIEFDVSAKIMIF